MPGTPCTGVLVLYVVSSRSILHLLFKRYGILLGMRITLKYITSGM